MLCDLKTTHVYGLFSLSPSEPCTLALSAAFSCYPTHSAANNDSQIFLIDSNKSQVQFVGQAAGNIEKFISESEKVKTQNASNELSKSRIPQTECRSLVFIQVKMLCMQKKVANTFTSRYRGSLPIISA